jgi:hypothetical protein
MPIGLVRNVLRRWRRVRGSDNESVPTKATSAPVREEARDVFDVALAAVQSLGSTRNAARSSFQRSADRGLHPVRAKSRRRKRSGTLTRSGRLGLRDPRCAGVGVAIARSARRGVHRTVTQRALLHADARHPIRKPQLHAGGTPVVSTTLWLVRAVFAYRVHLHLPGSPCDRFLIPC